MSQRVVILGSGGHAKVIVEILRARPCYEIVGCLTPDNGAASSVLGVPRLGDDDLLGSLQRQGVFHVFVAVGDNRLRMKLSELARGLGFGLVNAISTHAVVSPSAQLADGVAIMPGAHVGPECQIGTGVIVNSHATVDHDGRIGAYAHLGPGATLAGCVTIGEQSFVATGACVIPAVQVGARTLVGAGAVVVRDLPADVVAYGNPARVRRGLMGPALSTSQNHAGVPAPVPIQRRAG